MTPQLPTPRPGFDLDGLTVQETALLCLRSRKAIYNLLHRYNLTVKRVWVPVQGCWPLKRQIMLLPPGTVAALRRLTRDRI